MAQVNIILIHRSTFEKTKWPIIHFFSDDFGLRSPVIQKTVQTKNATSIVAHVEKKSITTTISVD